MKIVCDIIRDILPLYAEDMVSDATREMVEEHLGECEGCSQELHQLRNEKPLIRNESVAGLKLVKKSIRKEKMLTASVAVLLLLSFGLWIYGFMNVPVYLSQEEAVKSVYLAENGALVIDYYDYVRGSCGLAQPGYTQAHICYSTRWDMLSHKNGWVERVWDRKLVSGTTVWESKDGKGVIAQADENTPPEEIVEFGTDKSWWYLDYRTAQADTLLWDAGEERPTGEMVGVLYNLGYVALTAAVLGILALFLERYIKSKNGRRIVWNVGVLGIAFGAATVLILGTQTVIYYDFAELLSYISVLAILLWAAIATMWKLRMLEK